MAASGIGASDVVSATVAGAEHGNALLWALACGALLKFLLSENLARWQLATGQTVVEGWARHLPRWVLWVFAGYLVVWAAAVSGALTGGCGLAIENLTGGAVPRSWGAAGHAVIAYAAILSAQTGWFPRVMKPLIGVMFFSIVVCALLTFQDWAGAARGLWQIRVPDGDATAVLSIMGGIGGSLTLLSYSYLMRSEGGLPGLGEVRRDLAMGYLFTALFGGAVMLIANEVFHQPGVAISDRDAVSRMAGELALVAGPVGFYIYSAGFWAAVVASLLGVWQTAPAIFADTVRLLHAGESGGTPSPAYRWGVTFMAAVSIPFAFLDRPLLVIIAFTVVGSVFLPFLAATLLYLNNRILNCRSRQAGHGGGAPAAANGWIANLGLVLVLVLFVLVGGLEISAILRRL